MAQNNVTLTIQQLDATGTTVARRVFTSSDTAPTVGEWREGNLINNSLTSISLPVAQVRQVLIRNTHATATITVTWTPNGGASAVAGVIGPGDELSMWSQATGASYGISALSLQSSAASNTTFEMFLGG